MGRRLASIVVLEFLVFSLLMISISHAGTSPPTGSIIINNNDEYSNSTAVVLSLTYRAFGATVDKIRLSNDGVWNSEKWEDPNSTIVWTLTAGNGLKTVYYQIMDNDTSVSSTYSDTITLDTTSPTGSIAINNGNTYTNSTAVTLFLTYKDIGSDVSQVRYSNDGTWNTEQWETPALTKAWTLTTGDGTKTVYYQIKDKAGLTSPTYTDTITLDTTPPTGSITINNGADSTTSTSVSLTLTYSDANGVSQVRYSNDGTWNTEQWETPALTKAWTLTTGDGTKTVYYQIKDKAGLTSPTFSCIIFLASAAPTGSIKINGGATTTSSTSVTLSLTYNDTVSGVDQVRYSNDGVWDNEAWESPEATRAWTLTAGDGTKTVYYQIKSNAGVVSVTYSDTITLNTATSSGNTDTSPSSDTIKPNADAGQDQTIQEDTTLAFSGSASSDNIGIVSYTWTFTDGTDITLTGVNPTYVFETPGDYTVTLTVKDQAGNSATDTVKITVVGNDDVVAPVANAGIDQTTSVGVSTSFHATASSDNVGIVSYEWDFGDGGTGSGMDVTHVFAAEGNYNVTLTVKDQAGNLATDTSLVEVSEGNATSLWAVALTVLLFAGVGAVVLYMRKQP